MHKEKAANKQNTNQTNPNQENLSLGELTEVNGGKRITSVSKSFWCQSCGWKGMVTTYTNGTIGNCPNCHNNNWKSWDDPSSQF